MPLATGSRLGPYEILDSIGAGGMGEVYRERDSCLNRDVAIKILPVSFRRDPARMALRARSQGTLIPESPQYRADLRCGETASVLYQLVGEE